MNIVLRKTKDLHPYELNQKKHSAQQIRNVAASICRFGWQQPIVIDETGTIVIGHCRWMAAKRLKLEEVPCTVASGLTEDEINELRIADNKTNESEWDFEALGASLEGLTFEGMDFTFDLPEAPQPQKEAPNEAEDDEGGYFGDERERTMNRMRLREFDPFRAAGYYQLPTLEPCGYVPESMTRFNEVVTGEYADTVHFFTDDYRFERLWTYPERYIGVFKERAKAVLTPDYSLYTDMPEALRIYNVYRSRLIGQMMQDAGLQVIPTLQWAQKSTFKYCFEGLPKFGTVAVSTVGVMSGGDAGIWHMGMREAIKRLQPTAILIYGSMMPDFDFQGIPVRRYENQQSGVKKRG